MTNLILLQCVMSNNSCVYTGHLEAVRISGDPLWIQIYESQPQVPSSTLFLLSFFLMVGGIYLFKIWSTKK